MRSLIRNLLWLGAGVALAWVANFVRGSNTPWDPSDPNTRAPTARTEPGADAERPDDPEHFDAVPAEIVAAPAPAPAPVATDSAPGEPARVTVVWSAPKDSRIVSTDIPNRRANDDKGSRPATDLLAAGRITCDWGPGNVTGARVGDTLSVFPGSQWQGSLMVYDLLEGSAGKVRLSGTVGAVGSPTGEADVEIATVGSRIYFIGFLPNGTYVATTIYNELDNMDRHVAVMSRHENAVFNYGTQQLGVCY